jgi:hypothetical protein
LESLSWNITRGGDEPRERREEEQQANKETKNQMQFIKAKGGVMYECNMMT